ncbi:uncharacterized protein B0I36DRAFT_361365 [Microdochium trichocladiopsis]|uniref:NB-ARC domain-containing protein n=1 Tax=Microdochium trichocladiopsis TaxID=1682393 RepID=A0A9P8Y8C0_9PEZI|nr:uncharacterized protein B0I36DRAFT_361365 [Microdochium trichocladiopsis]KAH7032571.1 hypothetical protein B0I36DRAFT_361365 [Microdochium trichocladiopsis]
MAASTTFERIDGRTVLAGTHVSGGVLNVTVHEPESTPRHAEPFSTVPFLPDADFVERPDVTAWLDKTLAQPGSRAALVGLGGIGKSQVAIEYAHRVRQQSPSTYVLWVHADTQARFEEAYRGIADRLQLPQRYDPKVDVLQLVYN